MSALGREWQCFYECLHLVATDNTRHQNSDCENKLRRETVAKERICQKSRTVLVTKKVLMAPRGATDIAQLFETIGSGGRDRTYDQLINSQLLYR